ncbi:MAG TPA: sigma 54-interacting transcriptional regulator, partial [Vicinamibacteria bacterium]|nr:sigma 54-interacting transcriptional regulator [Vicinamibacteria bacterium]
MTSYSSSNVVGTNRRDLAPAHSSSPGWPLGAPSEHADLQEQLRRSLEEARQLRDRLHRERVQFREQARSERAFDEVVGASAALRTVFEQVNQVAATDSPVLLLGETGTGK